MLGVNRFVLGALSAALAILVTEVPCKAQEQVAQPSGARKVVVIPIDSPIDKPVLYILRRGLKDAIANKVDTVVINMNTPGGRLDVTLDIMEALDRFPGKKITFVNDEATSAGAIIASVTDQIYFTPKATIGSSEVIDGSGQDIGESAKRKINSYMGAKIRSYTQNTPLRAEVIRAMMDPEFELKVGDQIIKPKGELLNITAVEANKHYGTPPAPLLGTGIANNLNELLDQVHGKGNYSTQQMELTWAENLAQYLTQITPLLLAIGLLGLFIEFKTPGFGIFGIAGILLLAVVFFGHHVAGLAGFEPILFLLLGIILIAVEIFFFPGTVAPAITGAVLILGSLVWTMLDIWPDEPVSFSGDTLLRPMVDVSLGVIGAVILFIGMIKFLPQGGPWGRMILDTAVGGEPEGIRPILSQGETPARSSDLVGKNGKAVTTLFPSGQVEIDGKRYEARLDLGFADAGTPIRVTGIAEFGLKVEVIS